MAPIRLIGLIALCLAAPFHTAHAENWVSHGVWGDVWGKATGYIDHDSVRVENGLVHMRIKQMYEKSLTLQGLGVPSGTRIIVTSEAHNCEDKTWALTSLAFFDSSGKSLGSLSIPKSEWEFRESTPGTLGGYLNAKACEITFADTPALPEASARRGAPTSKVLSSGTAFVVSRDGMLLTNTHVVDGCASVQVRDTVGNAWSANIIAADANWDLALLKVAARFPSAGTFRSNRYPVAGENIIVLGFPLAGMLSSNVNVSSGAINATTGLRDDITQFQMSAPVQFGNSGGPVLDSSGNIIGVVVQKLDAVKVAQLTGDIPQNVNFALKGELAQIFLASRSVAFQSAASEKKLEAVEVAALGKAITLRVQCLK